MLKYMNNKYKLNNTFSSKHKTQVKYLYIHYKFQEALNFGRTIAVWNTVFVSLYGNVLKELIHSLNS